MVRLRALKRRVIDVGRETIAEEKDVCRWLLKAIEKPEETSFWRNITKLRIFPKFQRVRCCASGAEDAEGGRCLVRM